MASRTRVARDIRFYCASSLRCNLQINEHMAVGGNDDASQFSVSLTFLHCGMTCRELSRQSDAILVSGRLPRYFNGSANIAIYERCMSLVVGLDLGTQSVELVTHTQSLASIANDDRSREQKSEWSLGAIRACFAILATILRTWISDNGYGQRQRHAR